MCGTPELSHQLSVVVLVHVGDEGAQLPVQAPLTHALLALVQSVVCQFEPTQVLAELPLQYALSSDGLQAPLQAPAVQALRQAVPLTHCQSG